MNQIKTGKLIAELRQKSGMTQQVLGEKLGVTNKTVSRWENGNYMPDIEMLPLIASKFDITVDELLRGEKDSHSTSCILKAEKATPNAQISSQFTLEEQKKYLKKKWRREHIFLYAVLTVILLSIIIILIAIGKPWFILPAAPLFILLSYGWQNNRMMSYVEDHIYVNYPKR